MMASDLFFPQAKWRAESARARLILERLLEASSGQTSDALRAYRRLIEESQPGFVGPPSRSVNYFPDAGKPGSFPFEEYDTADEARLGIEARTLDPIKKQRFIDQVEQARQQQAIGRVLGTVSDIMGIPQERLSNDPQSMQAILAAANTFNKTALEYYDPEGNLVIEEFNTATGERKPISRGVRPQGYGMPAYAIRFDPSGRVAGVEPIFPGMTEEQISAKRRIDLAAAREAKFRESAGDVAGALIGIRQLITDAQSSDLLGTIGKVSQLADSFVSQVGQVIGEDNLRAAQGVADRYIDQLPETNAIKRAAVQNARLRATLRNTAIMLARARDPGADRLSNVRIQDAMASLTSDAPGSREQFIQTLYRTAQDLKKNLRSQGSEFRIDADQEIKKRLPPDVYDFFYKDILEASPIGDGVGGEGVIVIDEEGTIIENTTKEKLE